MKIVNVNDIEDIIEAKIEIDKNDPDVKGRSNLSEFIKKYCSLTDILIYNDTYKAFKYVECFDKKYLFVSNVDDVPDILILLKRIEYKFDNLVEFNNFSEMMNSNIQMLMHNNKYYKI